jgi:hypothetical protein
VLLRAVDAVAASSHAADISGATSSKTALKSAF